MAQNRQQRIAIIWFGTALVGLLLVLLPGPLRMDMMNGGFALLMLRTNVRDIAKLSADLRENQKEVFEAYVSSMWSHQTNAPRRSSVRIFGGPLATRGTRFYAELRRRDGRGGASSVKEEYEVSRRLYGAVKARQRVRAEVAPHSRVVLVLLRV